MDKKESIRVGIVNDYDPSGTFIVPEDDFVFAAVHREGDEGAHVICEGFTDNETATCCFLSALDGLIKTVTNRGEEFQDVFNAVLLARIAEMFGGEDDKDGDEE